MSDITCITTIYRRPQHSGRLIDACWNQTVKPKEVIAYVNGHEDNECLMFDYLNCEKFVENSWNTKFIGRFAFALQCQTEFCAVFDDDSIPGKRWFENCLETYEKTPGIMVTAGVTFTSRFYNNHVRCGWANPNERTERVDMGGHAWFFRTDDIKYLWYERPTSWDNGEDIQLSARAKRFGNVNTYCPAHPADNSELWGSTDGNKLGIDAVATSCNRVISHTEFFGQRTKIMAAELNGNPEWETVRDFKRN